MAPLALMLAGLFLLLPKLVKTLEEKNPYIDSGFFSS